MTAMLSYRAPLELDRCRFRRKHNSRSVRLNARMPLSFDASAVAFERSADLNAECLVLAEHQDGSGRRFEVQRSTAADEQDKALGQDTYCLVTETGATHYGAVRHWQIDGSMLLAELDETAALALETDTLRIGLPQTETASVERALRALLV